MHLDVGVAGVVNDNLQSKTPIHMLALTKSRMVIDCADEDSEAIYSCVAQSTSERLLVSSTYVHVVQHEYDEKSGCLLNEENHPAANIYMWSGIYAGAEGSNAVLLCRAAGFPKPNVTWVGRDGKQIFGGDRHEILPSGDLKIRRLSWKDDMGSYRCWAENHDSSESHTLLVVLVAKPSDSFIGWMDRILGFLSYIM